MFYAALLGELDRIADLDAKIPNRWIHLLLRPPSSNSGSPPKSPSLAPSDIVAGIILLSSSVIK
jgi:hypothetical protein